MNYGLRVIFAMVILSLLLVAPPVTRTDAKIAVSPIQWYSSIIQKGNRGMHPSIALNPVTLEPHVTFYDYGDTSFYQAYRLKTVGGNCNGGIMANPVIGWQCPVIANTGTQGIYSVIAYENGGYNGYGIATVDPTNHEMVLRRYTNNDQLVNTATYSTAPSWTGASTLFPGLAYSANHAYTVFYEDGYSTGTSSRWSALRWLDNPISGTYTTAPALEAYEYSNPPALGIGYYASLDIGSTGTMRVAYRSAGNTALRYAEYTGSGSEASCPVGSVSGPYWFCHLVDPGTGTGTYISFHASKGPSDPTRIAYYDSTNHQVKLATWTGSGSCGGTSGWQCQVIDTVGSNSGRELGVSLVIAGAAPAIAYIDNDDQANSILKLARYVISGGNCGPSNSWFCEVVDDGSGTDNLESAALAYEGGYYYIAYHNATQGALMVAHTKFLLTPTFSMSYSPNTIFLGQKTRATYTITNNQSIRILGGIAFNHGFGPFATFVPGSLSTNCEATIAFLVSNHAMKVTNGILGPNASCSISVDLVPAVAGNLGLSTTNLSSEATDALAASASLTVKHGTFIPITIKP